MSLSTQRNASDATQLIENTLGNAASWSSSSGIRRKRNPVKEDNENDATKYSTSNHLLRKLSIIAEKNNQK